MKLRSIFPPFSTPFPHSNRRLIDLTGFFKLHRFGVKRSDRHRAGLRRLSERQFFTPPILMNLTEIIRQRRGRPAELYAPGLGRRDALRLPRPDVAPLILRRKGENLQNNVAEEGRSCVPGGQYS